MERPSSNGKGPEAHRAGRGSAGVKVLAGLDGGGPGAGASARAGRAGARRVVGRGNEHSLGRPAGRRLALPFYVGPRLGPHLQDDHRDRDRPEDPATLVRREFTFDIDELLLDQVVDDTSTVKLEVFDSKGDEDTCLGVCTVPILPMLDKNVRRRWMALDSPYAKPACKGAAYGDVPGWSLERCAP